MVKQSTLPFAAPVPVPVARLEPQEWDSMTRAEVLALKQRDPEQWKLRKRMQARVR